MKFQEYPDADIMMTELSGRIAELLAGCLSEHEFATLVVPGGSTPGPVFDELSAVDLDWSRVHILLSDERWVPADDPRSNARLIRERLLTGHAAAAEFLEYYQHGSEPEDAIVKLSEKIASNLPISVLLLGMGADMHTASLFPNTPDLAKALDKNAPNIVAMRPPETPESRVTLTAPVLQNARHIHVVITGPEKRKALEHAASLTDAEAPIRTVLPNATIHWAP